MALQPDGKIIVAAGSLIRYERDGVLDAGFGTAGVVSGPIVAGSVALQPDGKLIVAGTFPLSFESTDCIVARYLANGTIDATFGTGGIAQANSGDSHSSCDDVIVQPDGRIVVAAGDVPFTTLRQKWMARFDADGTRDNSFGVGGVVAASVQGINLSIALQPDGKFLALGGDQHGLSGMGLARYDPSGALDPTFGEGGRIVWEFPERPPPAPVSMALQSDGRIVILNHGIVGRFLPDGSRDLTFGSGGIVTGTAGTTIATQSNGKIIVAGGAGGVEPATGFELWCFDSSGQPDRQFGDGGTVVTPLLDIGTAVTVAIQADGRIIAGGWAEAVPPPVGTRPGTLAAIARYGGC